MFAQRALDTSSNHEGISPARERSTELMKQIFESLSEGMIHFSWNPTPIKSETDLHDFEASNFEQGQRALLPIQLHFDF